MEKKCPSCGSTNVMGFAEVTDYAYINLDDFSVDETLGDPELAGDVTEFRCSGCDHEWEELPDYKEEYRPIFDAILDKLPKLDKLTHKFTFKF